MSHEQTAIRNLVAASRRLAEMDPQDEAVERTVQQLTENANLLRELAGKDKSSPWGKGSMDDDAEFIGEQIKRLKAAAAVPARNYRRIHGILDALEKVWTVASRPQNSAVRPKVAAAVKKVAGVFAEVDTVGDLDKPLEQIEKAVHSLYGNQSLNSTYFFDRRGKGHHSKEE